MKQQHAIAALSALAHEARLTIFRDLIEAGPDGRNASELSRRAGISPSSLTFHAATLERAGLVSSHKRGREVIYAPCIETVSGLVNFLAMRCCNGHPDLCRSLGEIVQLDPSKE